MADECKHEWEQYPEMVVKTLKHDGPFAGMDPPPRIVTCLKCGAPIDRGRFQGMTHIPDLYVG